MMDNSEAGITKETIIILVVSVVVVLATAVVLVNPIMQNAQSGSPQTAQSSAGNLITTSSSLNNPSGAQNQSAVWSKYLGYIPQGYTISSRLPNSPVFPCPAGMSDTQCKQFQSTCGNGVCDPNETCQSCPIDCGASGSQVCDPYTGRPGAPAQVCQLRAG
jgi:hypothetical protein